MTPDEIDALPPVLRVDDVAKILDIGRDTVYVLAKSGEIPALRLGRALRFSRDRIVALIDGR